MGQRKSNFPDVDTAELRVMVPVGLIAALDSTARLQRTPRNVLATRILGPRVGFPLEACGLPPEESPREVGLGV